MRGDRRDARTAPSTMVIGHGSEEYEDGPGSSRHELQKLMFSIIYA